MNMESQRHGLDIEELIIHARTGLTKESYQLNIPHGYVSPMDIVRGVYSSENVSVKSTRGNTIDCADVLKFYDHCLTTDFKMTVCSYTQKNDHKLLHTICEFSFSPKYFSLLWGSIPRDVLTEFVLYVRAIPVGKNGQKTYAPLWKAKRKQIYELSTCGIMKFTAKVDSKSQRRVQCNCRLSDLKLAIPFVEYTSTYYDLSLPKRIESLPRVRHTSSRSVLHKSELCQTLF